MTQLLRDHKLLTVSEAAQLLGRTTQAVRDLVASGELPAVRAGRQLLVPAAGLARLQRLPRPVGRPLAPTTAWAMLGHLSGAGAGAAGLAGRSLVRLQVLAQSAPLELAARLRVRAHAVGGVESQGAWRRLLEDPLVRPSGLPAPVPTAAYVQAGAVDELRSRHRVGGPVGQLRVIPRGVPIAVLPEGRRVPGAARALDWLEEDDPDLHEAGRTGFLALCADLAAS